MKVSVTFLLLAQLAYIVQATPLPPGENPALPGGFPSASATPTADLLNDSFPSPSPVSTGESSSSQKVEKPYDNDHGKPINTSDVENQQPVQPVPTKQTDTPMTNTEEQKNVQSSQKGKEREQVAEAPHHQASEISQTQNKDDSPTINTVEKENSAQHRDLAQEQAQDQGPSAGPSNSNAVYHSEVKIESDSTKKDGESDESQKKIDEKKTQEGSTTAQDLTSAKESHADNGQDKHDETVRDDSDAGANKRDEMTKKEGEKQGFLQKLLKPFRHSSEESEGHNGATAQVSSFTNTPGQNVPTAQGSSFTNTPGHNGPTAQGSSFTNIPDHSGTKEKSSSPAHTAGHNDDKKELGSSANSPAHHDAKEKLPSSADTPSPYSVDEQAAILHEELKDLEIPIQQFEKVSRKS